MAALVAQTVLLLTANTSFTGHLPLTSLGQAPGGLGHKEEAGLLQEGLRDSLGSSVAGPTPRGGGART